MIDLDDIHSVGVGLNRPECVLTTANGRIYTANFDGGVSIIEPDGSQWSLLAKGLGLELKPNGICLMEDGSFLIAHLGAECGGVYRLAQDGNSTAFCTEVDGVPLPPTNFVHLDKKGRVWITVSTRKIPRSDGYRADVQDGFIVLCHNGESRIVADNLGYTNECGVHPDGTSLYVNETFSRKLIKYEIAENGDLFDKRIVAEFSAGTFPDGLAFDSNGEVWVTSIVSNRVIHINKQGEINIVVEDCDENHLLQVENAFQIGNMGRPHLDTARSVKLKNTSSLAFGGENLDIAYLGCLLDQCIYKFKASHSGYPPVHWGFSGPRREK